MKHCGSPVLALVVTYWFGVLAARWLVLHAFALDRPTIVALAAVPVVQALVLAGWRRTAAAFRRPR